MHVLNIGQVSNQEESEILSYEFALEEALKVGDSLSIKQLTEIGSPPYNSDEETNNAVQIERRIVSKYVPSKFTMSIGDMIKQLLLYNGWSLSYKWNQISEGGYGRAAPLLWPTAARINLFDVMTEWPIPIYILQGENDHFTETRLAKMYYDSLSAPKKEFFLFKDMGHMVISEDPERYREIYIEYILKE